MRLVELFAGSGGAALGLEAAGYSHIHCVERDQDACKTLRYAGFPAWEDSVENYCEFVKRGGPPEEPVDAVWASFPCQPFSSAGKRNINDKRNLWDGIAPAQGGM
jgi:DNA (cytosine-5)-methyltransferase 1